MQARMGRPSKAPQLTPAPSATTSPSSTARPGEKCWPAFEKNSQYEHREACDEPSAMILQSDHRQ
jgi:hypothetical protein